MHVAILMQMSGIPLQCSGLLQALRYVRTLRKEIPRKKEVLQRAIISGEETGFCSRASRYLRIEIS